MSKDGVRPYVSLSIRSWAIELLLRYVPIPSVPQDSEEREADLGVFRLATEILLASDKVRKQQTLQFFEEFASFLRSSSEREWPLRTPACLRLATVGSSEDYLYPYHSIARITKIEEVPIPSEKYLSNLDEDEFQKLILDKIILRFDFRGDDFPMYLKMSRMAREEWLALKAILEGRAPRLPRDGWFAPRLVRLAQSKQKSAQPRRQSELLDLKV